MIGRADGVTWARTRLRFLMDEIDERAGSASETLPLLSVSIHRGVIPRAEMTDRESRADDFVNYKRVAPGDIVINRMRAFEGGAGVSAYEGMVSSDYAVLRTGPRLDPRFFHHLIRSRWFVGEMIARLRGIGNVEAGNVRTPRINVEDLGDIEPMFPALAEQQAIAGYLDAEISDMDYLLAKKRRLVELLQEQIDSAIMEQVGRSAVVQGDHQLRALPVHRLLAKLDRPPEPDAQVITAFRDGQVTARALRRSEGFTESWTEGARVQGVLGGDVVVHGLDGFAGAIGTAEADGVCSPVYHVCSPIDGGDAHFYSGMLRLLAATGYLGNFATSTRERAVDFRNWDLFGRIPIPIVEVAEQRRIGDRIRRLAPIREHVARSEVLINERRQALITAAVTGQLDIPGVNA